MEQPPPNRVTQVILALQSGDASVSSELLALVYAELKAIARRHMRHERKGHTLQTTALIHEAYIRLLGDQSPSWDSRGHFYSAAAEAMRRVLVDHARSVGARKRGAGRRRVALDEGLALGESECDEMLDLDEALNELEQVDERAAMVVKLRYFGGLSIDETAGIIGVSPATVKNDWSYGRAWLHRALGGEADA